MPKPRSEPEIPATRAIQIAALIAIALVALPEINRQLTGSDAPTATNPIAAVAWAQSNCWPGLALKSTSARIDADLLLEMAASFESDRNRRGIESACANAVHMGKDAADPRTMPQYSGERPSYAARVEQDVAAN